MDLSKLTLQELEDLRRQIDDEIVHRSITERPPMPHPTRDPRFARVIVSEDEMDDALEDLKSFGHTISHTYNKGKEELTTEYVDARDAFNAFDKLRNIYDISLSLYA